MIAAAGRVIKKLVDEAGRRRDLPDHKRLLAHALKGCAERLHMGYFARHQELQRIFSPCIVAEVDKPFVDDFGPRLGRDIAAQIDIQFPGDF